MDKIWRAAEYGFTGAAVFVFSGAMLLLILSGGANEGDVEVTYDTSLYRLAFLLIYFVTLCLLAYRWKKSFYKLTKAKLIFGFILLAVSSILWSSEPDATFRESVKLVGSGLFGLYLSTRYNLKQLLLILGCVFGISIILSFIFSILLPQYGLMGGVHSGTWRGIYLHKNGLGSRMVMAISIFLTLVFDAHRYKWMLYIGIALAVILLLLSQSISALLNTVFCIVFFLTLKTLRWNYRLMVSSISTLIVMAMLAVAYLVNNAEFIANFLGRDLTFSGRTLLWATVWKMIQVKPLLGYGYDGFWHGMDGESAYVWTVTGWRMTHAHNGFIEVCLELGLIGLIVFFFSFIINLSRSLALIRLSSTPVACYPTLSFLLLFTSNLTESSLLSSELVCSIYVFLTLAIPKELACTQKNKTRTSLSGSTT